MKTKIVIPLFFILSGPSYGELLDPRTRDEDISAAEVTVSIVQDGAGLYRYEYTLTSPPANRGTIGTMLLDVSCPGPVEPRADLSQLGLSTGSSSLTGHHVPVAVGGGFTMGVNEEGSVQWGRQLSPGGVGTALVVSPYGPGPRQYTLEPSMGPEGYDYQSYMNAPGLYPWIPDFTVVGFTRGPACPGDEEPIEDEPTEEPHFAGTLYPNESEFVNGLLTYSAPTRDRFHMPSGSQELELTIHYSAEIDPKSFRVMPQKHNLRDLFNPQPDSTETVLIRLDKGKKNKIQLQVKPKILRPRDIKDDEYHGRGPDTDQDEFEIRIEGERENGKSAAKR